VSDGLDIKALRRRAFETALRCTGTSPSKHRRGGDTRRTGAINAPFAQRIHCLGAIDGAAHSAVVERRRSQRANYCVRKLSALDTVSSGGGLLMMEAATGADDSASRARAISEFRQSFFPCLHGVGRHKPSRATENEGTTEVLPSTKTRGIAVSATRVRTRRIVRTTS
jgi:hypothetical protein